MGCISLAVVSDEISLRDLWPWLPRGATTWCTICFFWMRHPSDIVISKKNNFIFQIFKFFQNFRSFLFLFFAYDLSCWSSFYTQTLRNCCNIIIMHSLSSKYFRDSAQLLLKLCKKTLRGLLIVKAVDIWTVTKSFSLKLHQLLRP